jgi:hypothetical protein
MSAITACVSKPTRAASETADRIRCEATYYLGRENAFTGGIDVFVREMGRRVTYAVDRSGQYVRLIEES